MPACTWDWNLIKIDGLYGIGEAYCDWGVKDMVVQPVKPMWLEDPVPPENVDAMARVTESINIRYALERICTAARDFVNSSNTVLLGRPH